MGSIKRTIENLRAKMQGVSRDLAEKEKKRKDVIRTIPPEGTEWSSWGADAPEWKDFMKKADILRLSGLTPSRPSIEEAAEQAIKDASKDVQDRDEEIKRLRKLLDTIEGWNRVASECDQKVSMAELKIEQVMSGTGRADQAAAIWLAEVRQTRTVEAKRHFEILKQAIRIIEESIASLE